MKGETLARKMGIAALGAAALIGVACGKEQAPPSPPPEVKVATVLHRDVPIYVEAIGETRGSTEIVLRARVEGFIQTIDFKEGTPVRKGQLLYTIDPRPFEAAVAQARGQLAEAEARLARATQDVVRYEPLVARNAISRQDYEKALAVQWAAEGAVAAAKASAERAEIDLGYTRVVAPRRWPRGQDPGLPGDARGARAEHASHPHLTDPDDPRPRRGPRAGVPPLRAQGPGM